MERIYCDAASDINNEEVSKLCLEMVLAEEDAKERFNKDDFKIWLYAFHNYVREKLNLPNKLFLLAVSLDKTRAQMVFFPKEPDGNCYKGFYDEELKLSYILVE